MVFQRYNVTDSNPNPHINFISALKEYEDASREAALNILRALAAQVRPVMKKHGLEVNSFDEYEHNQVFLGRNWNNGETIELVLRRADGSFYSTPHLLDVLCHELSHILHMNHGPGFWAYYRRLKREVYALQRANYFGDGFWSSGQALQDGTREERVREVEDLPEYLCGGAHATSPPGKSSKGRKRRATKQTGPSAHTGAQVAKKRKAGTRVKGANVFKGEGKALNDNDDEERRKLGSTFRKQAGSKRARDLRVAAIEARLQRLQGSSTSKPEDSLQPSAESGSEDEEEDDFVAVNETDADRRRMMTDAMGESEMNMTSLKNQTRLPEFWRSGNAVGTKDTKETRDTKEAKVSKPKASGSNSMSRRSSKFPQTLIEISDSEDTESDDGEDAQELLKRLGLSVEEEPEEPETVPAEEEPPPKNKAADADKGKRSSRIPTMGPADMHESKRRQAETPIESGGWCCEMCTYINEKPLGLSCEMCGSLRLQDGNTSGVVN